MYNRYRDHCECSDETPSADERKKQEECRKCAGDESEYCGGPERISIYENDWFGLLNFILKLHIQFKLTCLIHGLIGICCRVFIILEFGDSF